MPMFTIDTALYSEMLANCEALGLPGMSEAEARQEEERAGGNLLRTAYHEAGHAICYLRDGVRFEGIKLKAGGGGAISFGPAPYVLRVPSLAARIRGEVGGAVAETMLFDTVDPIGAWEDLRMVLARAASPEQASFEVERVRGMLQACPRALNDLAFALLMKRPQPAQVTYAECVEVVRAAGVRVDGPRYDHITPAEEGERCKAVKRDMAAQKKARPLEGRNDVKPDIAPKVAEVTQLARIEKLLEEIDEGLEALEALGEGTHEAPDAGAEEGGAAP